MFGKLLKNDLKAQWHSVSVILLCIAVVSAVAEIFAITTKNNILSALSGLLVLFVLVFACIVMVIAVSMLFSKTVFGRAGYLTLTLPSKTRDLVWSKTVSGLIWISAVFSLMVGYMFLWVYQVDQRFGEQIGAAKELLSFFGAPSFAVISIIVAIYIVYFAVFILLAVQSIYFGITLSNVSPLSKFGNFGAIIFTFVCFFAISSVTSAIGELLPIGVVLTETNVHFTTNFSKTLQNLGESVIFKQNITGMLLNLASALLLNLPVTYLIKNKVNIK